MTANYRVQVDIVGSEDLVCWLKEHVNKSVLIGQCQKQQPQTEPGHHSLARVGALCPGSDLWLGLLEDHRLLAGNRRDS